MNPWEHTVTHFMSKFAELFDDWDNVSDVRLQNADGYNAETTDNFYRCWYFLYRWGSASEAFLWKASLPVAIATDLRCILVGWSSEALSERLCWPSPWQYAVDMYRP